MAQPSGDLLLRCATKALSPDDFADPGAVANRLLTFQQHYNNTARLFDWTFTRDDLNQLLHRLGHHTTCTHPDHSPHNPRRTNGRAH